jgi:hypothetical protein
MCEIWKNKLTAFGCMKSQEKPMDSGKTYGFLAVTHQNQGPYSEVASESEDYPRFGRLKRRA